MALSKNEDDFAFDAGNKLETTYLTIEELFDGGLIKPLKPPPHFRRPPLNKQVKKIEEECTYFKWDNGKPSGGFDEGQSSSVGLDKSVGKEINEELTSMFKLLASISEEKDVEISLNLTIRKGQGKGKELDS
ncbi:Uncharacterized protein Fot_42016 [Forsythia ovata]|uniref:Uncharacterized protein n=1 Tax=Forsythia ovata TaxID=205694 RepID=A0ABD1RNS4_9LAMI